MIPFNKPYITGKEAMHMAEAMKAGKLSGNGTYTRRCQEFFEQHYGIRKALLTGSCTDALEMSALLSSIKPGDEVIAPSYTFVSTVLAFVREGARIVFCDSCKENPNIDPEQIEGLITERTRVIVPVHYAGVACDMDRIMEIAGKHGITVVEDAAQGVDSYYKGKALGSIGNMGCYSFHDTKNIIAGEGGLLAVNDPALARRSEIIWEKGTNRSEFFRGEVNKYGWVDTGSSFLPSELSAAFLWAQIEEMESIQTRRKEIWERYHELLAPMASEGFFSLPDIPEYATNNAHMFYIVCRSLEERTALIAHLKEHGITSVFHYLALHRSKFYTSHADNRPAHLQQLAEENGEAVVKGLDLPNCDRFDNCLLRLPLYYELRDEETDFIAKEIGNFFGK